MGSESKAKDIRHKIHTVLKPILIILSLLLFGLLIWVFLDKPSGHDQLLEKQRKFYLNHIDSLSKSYDEIIRQKDSAAYFSFKKAQESSNKWEAIARQSQALERKEVGLRRVFSDAKTDSLLSVVQ